MTRIGPRLQRAVRPRMAGIGIRYLELARRLPRRMGSRSSWSRPRSPRRPPRSLGLGGAEVRRFERGRLARDPRRTATRAVAQGQLANDLVLELPELPVAIDLYDPWLIENLSYTGTLGLDPYRNDHATWVLQMSRGDFFLCSSEEQRTFYLGFLTALGRVNPERMRAIRTSQSLIAPVPFGVPDELPPHRPVPARPTGSRRSGGSSSAASTTGTTPGPCSTPWRALDRPRWTLLLIRNPNRRARRSACSPRWRRAAASSAGGGAACGPSTGCRPSGGTTCCATWTSWWRRTRRAWRRACRCAPASWTPWPPAARWSPARAAP